MGVESCSLGVFVCCLRGASRCLCDLSTSESANPTLRWIQKKMHTLGTLYIGNSGTVVKLGLPL